MVDLIHMAGFKLIQDLPSRNKFETYLIRNTTGNGLSNVAVYNSNMLFVYVYFKYNGIIHTPYFEFGKKSIFYRGFYTPQQKRIIMFKLGRVLNLSNQNDKFIQNSSLASLCGNI